MRKLILSAGVAALAIAAPAAAKPGGHGGGGHGGDQAQTQRGGGGQAKAQRGGGGQRQAQVERGGGQRQAQVQRGGGQQRMRARNKLLGDNRSADPEWLTALEQQMAEHGTAIAGARLRAVSALGERLLGAPEDEFARASIELQGWEQGDLVEQLRESRNRDAGAGRATVGPHRQDLLVTHRAKEMEASRSSTGEQKALLLGLVLAHGRAKLRRMVAICSAGCGAA